MFRVRTAFTCAVVLAWAFVTAVAVDLYRTA